MAYKVAVKCPYCGITNSRFVDVDAYRTIPYVMTCDVEQGGCEKVFVIVVSATVHTKVWKVSSDETDA